MTLALYARAVRAASCVGPGAVVRCQAGRAEVAFSVAERHLAGAGARVVLRALVALAFLAGW